MSALIREQHDAGNTTIRDGQEESKYENLGKALTGDVAVLAQAKSYDDYQTGPGKPASSARGAEELQKDDGEKSEQDGSSSDDSDLDLASCLKGSLLDSRPHSYEALLCFVAG